jgi:FAD:protein FMN transferase
MKAVRGILVALAFAATAACGAPESNGDGSASAASAGDPSSAAASAESAADSTANSTGRPPAPALSTVPKGAPVDGPLGGGPAEDDESRKGTSQGSGPRLESGPGAVPATVPAADASRTRVVETHADGRLMLERTGGVMGTSMRLVAIGRDRAALEEALVAAEAELRRVEDLMTDWRASPLMDLNAAAGSGPVAVPTELGRLVERSLLVAELSGGAFDPTWRGVGTLWKLRADPPVVPDDAAIAAGLERVDFRRVAVTTDAAREVYTVELPAGFELGLGGIAKGYGVDRAMTVLMEHGVEHAVVDAGGDLKALGQHFDGPWEVAIRHPRRQAGERGDVMAVVPVSNACVVTSGDYERFVVIDGVRHHHILDPRTGRPSTGCMSATVVGPDAAVCDALATALCVLGPDDGLALIERSGAYQALAVGMDGAVRTTAGLESATR